MIILLLNKYAYTDARLVIADRESHAALDAALARGVSEEPRGGGIAPSG